MLSVKHQSHAAVQLKPTKRCNIIGTKKVWPYRSDLATFVPFAAIKVISRCFFDINKTVNFILQTLSNCKSSDVNEYDRHRRDEIK